MTVTDVLNDAVAQELLASKELARLAYTWRDGTARVVPMWFQWTGTEVVLASPDRAPKLKVLAARPEVSITVDSSCWPYHALLLRGVAKVEPWQGIVPEYAAAAERYLGAGPGRAMLAQFEAMGLSWYRIAVTPIFGTILDFQTRFPSAISA